MIDGVPVSFISVGDLDRAATFYQDIVGLEVRGRDAFGLFLHLGDGLLRMTPFPDYSPSGHPVLGWNVEDITAAAAALRERGVAFTIYDGMGQDADGIWTSPDGSARLAWFADSEGNVLSLSQA
jgi:predicted enzyme related to lactoylglutathione lyase